MTKRRIHLPVTDGKLVYDDVFSVVQAAHVAPTRGEWIVVKAGPKRVRRSFPSKSAAVAFAREMTATHPGEIIVHEADGRIVRGRSIQQR